MSQGFVEVVGIEASIKTLLAERLLAFSQKADACDQVEQIVQGCLQLVECVGKIGLQIQTAIHRVAVSPGFIESAGDIARFMAPAATITQEAVDEVTYWHVELDSHDILIANGLPAESYLEMGNRSFFAEAAIVELDAAPDLDPRTHADFCRPCHDGGPLVEVVHAQLLAQAERLGWRLDRSSAFADLHLVADGWRRDLGVWLAGLTIEDGFDARTVPLDDPRLCLGVHALEPDFRWTAGRARLPAALWDGREHGFYLRVDLAGPALPRWLEPGVDDVGGLQAAG